MSQRRNEEYKTTVDKIDKLMKYNSGKDGIEFALVPIEFVKMCKGNGNRAIVLARIFYSSRPNDEGGDRFTKVLSDGTTAIMCSSNHMSLSTGIPRGTIDACYKFLEKENLIKRVVEPCKFVQQISYILINGETFVEKFWEAHVEVVTEKRKFFTANKYDVDVNYCCTILAKHFVAKAKEHGIDYSFDILDLFAIDKHLYDTRMSLETYKDLFSFAWDEWDGWKKRPNDFTIELLLNGMYVDLVHSYNKHPHPVKSKPEKETSGTKETEEAKPPIFAIMQERAEQIQQAAATQQTRPQTKKENTLTSDSSTDESINPKRKKFFV